MSYEIWLSHLLLPQLFMADSLSGNFLWLIDSLQDADWHFIQHFAVQRFAASLVPLKHETMLPSIVDTTLVFELKKPSNKH